ncbi:hypothetical protein J6590_007977 [Homalodisca vitripennis]|nr:hypothetical protein J6590_007977 [Homalodisca vitripennis]
MDYNDIKKLYTPHSNPVLMEEVISNFPNEINHQNLCGAAGQTASICRVDIYVVRPVVLVMIICTESAWVRPPPTVPLVPVNENLLRDSNPGPAAALWASSRMVRTGLEVREVSDIYAAYVFALRSISQ